MEQLVSILSRLTPPATNNLSHPGPEDGSPPHRDGKKKYSPTNQNLFLNTTTLNMYTEGTSNIVQGRGDLKAHGLLTAPREPRHGAEPVTLPIQRTVLSETILST